MGSAGHRVAGELSVELDDGGLGRHGGSAVLPRPVLAVEQDQEASVELTRQMGSGLMSAQVLATPLSEAQVGDGVDGA